MILKFEDLDIFVTDKDSKTPTMFKLENGDTYILSQFILNYNFDFEYYTKKIQEQNIKDFYIIKVNMFLLYLFLKIEDYKEFKYIRDDIEHGEIIDLFEFICNENLKNIERTYSDIISISSQNILLRDYKDTLKLFPPIPNLIGTMLILWISIYMWWVSALFLLPILIIILRIPQIIEYALKSRFSIENIPYGEILIDEKISILHRHIKKVYLKAVFFNSILDKDTILRKDLMYSAAKYKFEDEALYLCIEHTANGDNEKLEYDITDCDYSEVAEFLSIFEV